MGKWFGASAIFFLVHHADLLWVVSDEFLVFTTEWHGVSRSFLFSFGRRDERTRWNSAYSLVDVMVSWTTLQRYRYEKRKSRFSRYIFNCFHSWSRFFKTCWLLVESWRRMFRHKFSFHPFNLSVVWNGLKRGGKIFIILYIINYLFYYIFRLFPLLI